MMRFFVLAFLLIGTALAQCSNTSYGNGFTCVKAAGSALGGAGSVTTANFGSNTTVGNVVVFFASACADAACTTNTAPSMAFTQSNAGGNTCTEVPGGPFETPQDQTQTNLSTKTTAWVCPVTTAGGDFTAHVTGGTPFYLAAYASEWSGVATSSFYDVVAMTISANSSATTSTVTTASTTNAVDLVLGYIQTSNDTITSGAGFSEILNIGGYIQQEGKSVAATGAQSCTWSHAASSTQGLCITLKAAAPPTPVVARRSPIKFRSGKGGVQLTLTELVGANNPNTPAPPPPVGGYVGGGTALSYNGCSGGDDTIAVQTLINSLATGDSLRIDCMVGVGPSGITLANKTNVKLFGNGTGGFKALAVTSIGSTGGFDRPGYVKVYNCTDCLVSDLDFNMNNIPTGGLLVDSSLRTEIRHNNIHDSSCELLTPSDCHGAAGITGDLNDGIRYINNTVSNTGSCGFNCNGIRGVWLRDTNALLWANTITNAGGTSAACNCIGQEFAYNDINFSGASGVKYAGSGAPPNENVGNAKLHHNLVRNAGQFLRLETTATTGLVQIYQNEASANVDGIYANNSPMNNTNITQNYFHNNTGVAIKLLSGLSNYLIQDNRLHNNAVGIHFGEVGGSFTSITVNRNDIRFNINGLQIQNSGSVTMGLTITNNAFTNGTYGLLIASGIGGTISESTNCWQSNATANISDGRGILTNPSDNGPCSNPAQ